MIVKDIVDHCPSTMEVANCKTGFRYWSGEGYDACSAVNKDFLYKEVDCFTVVQRMEQNQFMVKYSAVLKIFVKDEDY